jgi:hypothetical protein
MSDKTKNPIKWIAKGTSFHRKGDKPTHPPGQQPINIRECPKDIVMGAGDMHQYGQPIDAMLAIHYIRELWKEIQSRSTFEMYNKTKGFDFSLLTEEDHKKIIRSFTWLVGLLKYSAALTVSRSMLLKLLSQPECCGVRFYLGLERPDLSTEPKEKFTLVMVGVDNEGVDLNYEYHPNVRTSDSVPDVETMSLSGEYPAPSGLIGDNGPMMNEDATPYPLFKYAMS